jgi:ribosome recycling factor
VFPQLTEERRRDMVKIARTKAEDAKVSIRAVRRHAKDQLDRLVKDGEVGEDEVARAEKELEKTTGQYVEKVDALLQAKEAELLEV